MNLPTGIADDVLRTIARAERTEGDVRRWFSEVWLRDPRPLAVDAWLYSPDFLRVLVVEHRWRGLVPPGGRVEPGETIRQACLREVREETGLAVEVSTAPANIAVRRFKSDWTETLNFSYWGVVEPTSTLRGEDDQPPRWVDLRSGWRTYHPEDTRDMIARAELVRSTL